MSVLFRGQVKSGEEGARDRPGRECSHIFFGRLPMVLPRGWWVCSLRRRQYRDVAALVRSHINGLQPFESTIEQTPETMPPPPPPSHETITAAAMKTNELQAYETCYTTDSISYLARRVGNKAGGYATIF